MSLTATCRNIFSATGIRGFAVAWTCPGAAQRGQRQLDKLAPAPLRNPLNAVVAGPSLSTLRKGEPAMPRRFTQAIRAAEALGSCFHHRAFGEDVQVGGDHGIGGRG